MKIYTRTGDNGKTSLLSGKRVDKHDKRIVAYGSVDELNSLMGIVRDFSPKKYQNEISKAVKNIWSKRTDAYSEQRGEESKPKVEMSFIGG